MGHRVLGLKRARGRGVLDSPLLIYVIIVAFAMGHGPLEALASGNSN